MADMEAIKVRYPEMEFDVTSGSEDDVEWRDFRACYQHHAVQVVTQNRKRGEDWPPEADAVARLADRLDKLRVALSGGVDGRID